LAQPAAARRLVEEVAWGAPAEAAEAAHAEAPRQAAAPGGVEAAERAAEAVGRPEGPGAPVALPSAAPWADASAFRRDQVLPWPAPRPSARTVRAMEQRPIAWR